MEPRDLVLPLTLRTELKDPMGELIRGSIEETIPILKQLLSNRKSILIGVGDVTADLLVHNGFKPEIILTDGFTKREKLDDWSDYLGYEIIDAASPAAEITADAWIAIKEAISLVEREKKYVHIKINGEEDLLVLPLLVELPEHSYIIYGQPNEGAVIRVVDSAARERAIYLLNQMEIKK